MQDIYDALSRNLKEGRESVLATVVEKQGHGPTEVQSKMLIFADGSTLGTVGGGALEKQAREHALKLFQTKQGKLIKYSLTKDNSVMDASQTGMLCGGTVSLFFEYIAVQDTLLIFGAGHIGKALAYHQKALASVCMVADDRADQLRALDAECRAVDLRQEDIFQDRALFDNSYILIATYSHDLDYSILKKIYQTGAKPKYLGLIASQRKKKVIWERLHKDFGPEVDLSFLYCPCGLRLGGNTPQEIAISILAEIQAVRFGQEGHRHMRDS